MTPQELIELARKIDPALSTPEETLIEALTVARALEVLRQGGGARWQPGTPPDVVVAVEAESTLEALALKKRSQRRHGHKAESGQVKELDKYIREQGFTIEEVAQKLGCSDASVSAWLTGRWKPSEKNSNKIGQLINGEL